MFDLDRVVQCRRHTYQTPSGVVHRYWSVGVAPHGELMTGLLRGRSVVGPGTVRRHVVATAREAHQAEYWAEHGWSTRDDVPLTAMEERFAQARAAFADSPAYGEPSPLDAALARWHARMDWYVCDDADGAVGTPLRPTPFRFPTSCLAEGIVQERVMPDGQPNLLAGEGKDRQLQPYKGTDPAKVAEWWGCFHFGFPRVVRVRMQRVVRGAKVQLSNVDSARNAQGEDMDIPPLTRGV